MYSLLHLSSVVQFIARCVTGLCYTSPACSLQPSSSGPHVDNYFALLSGTSGPVDLRLLLVSGEKRWGRGNQWGLCTLADILLRLVCICSIVTVIVPLSLNLHHQPSALSSARLPMPLTAEFLKFLIKKNKFVLKYDIQISDPNTC